MRWPCKLLQFGEYLAEQLKREMCGVCFRNRVYLAMSS